MEATGPQERCRCESVMASAVSERSKKAAPETPPCCLLLANFPLAIGQHARAHLNAVPILICFHPRGALAVLLTLTKHVFILIYIYQRDMTVQFVACFVVTFTIIFLLGCFCMSWQIFIGYRNIIRSAHNRPHKAPCHTVVGRRMRSLDPAYSFCAPRTRAVFSEKWKK